LQDSPHRSAGALLPPQVASQALMPHCICAPLQTLRLPLQLMLHGPSPHCMFTLAQPLELLHVSSHAWFPAGHTMVIPLHALSALHVTLHGASGGQTIVAEAHELELVHATSQVCPAAQSIVVPLQACSPEQLTTHARSAGHSTEPGQAPLPL
jgi:hypothetical protein